MAFTCLADGRVQWADGSVPVLRFLPGLDGQPVSHREGAAYGDARGELTLRAEGDALRLGLRAREAVSAAEAICHARVTGVEGLFRQGLGLGGPSGYVAATEWTRERPLQSYGLLALRLAHGYLLLYTRELECATLRFDVQPDDRDPAVLWLTAGFQAEGALREAENLELIARRFDTLQDGLREVACEIAGDVAVAPKRPAYHWCSWYYYYNNLDAEQLRGVLRGLDTLEPRLPLNAVQIDAGYFPHAGDWLEPGALFPQGLRAAFDDIRAAGYTPGIWIAPFMVGNRSRLYAEHPDWVLRKREGGLVTPWQMYNEPKVWGYQDEEYYVLDTSHPDAMAHLLSVLRALREMGAGFFKTDFLLWGMQPTDEVVRHAPGKTSVQYYRDFMRGIRAAIGDSYWLGCIAPFLPMLGFADGMRIAGDVGAQWEEDGFGPASLLHEIVADSYLNGVYWQNDPDALLLRDRHLFLSSTEIESLALLQAVSGGAVYTSEDMALLPAERLALFRFLQPDAIHRPDTPFLDKAEKAVCFVHRLGERRLVFLLNPTGEPLDLCYPLRELTGDDSLFLRPYHGQPSADRRELVTGRLAPHGALLLFGHTGRAIAREPQNLWSWEA